MRTKKPNYIPLLRIIFCLILIFLAFEFGGKTIKEIVGVVIFVIFLVSYGIAEREIVWGERLKDKSLKGMFKGYVPLSSDLYEAVNKKNTTLK